MTDYFEVLKNFLTILKNIVGILAITGIVGAIYKALTKAEDFASIVGYFIILIKLLIIYFCGIIFIYVFYFFIIILLFLMQQSLKFNGESGKEMYTIIEHFFDHIIKILNLATIVFYNTPTVIAVNTITVVVLIILLVLYILYRIIKALGPFFSFVLDMSPFKELIDEGIFDFMDIFFGGIDIGNAVINFKPVKFAVNDLKTGLMKTALYIKAQKELDARNKAKANALLLKGKITKSGVQISNSCSAEKFINYKLDMIERFSNNYNVSMKTIEENLKMCLLKKFKHKDPNLSIIEREQNKFENKKEAMLCNTQAEIEKSLL